MTHPQLNWDGQTLQINGHAWDTPRGLLNIRQFNWEKKAEAWVSAELFRIGVPIALHRLNAYLQLRQNRYPRNWTEASEGLSPEHLKDIPTFQTWANERSPEQIEALLQIGANNLGKRSELLLLAMTARDLRHIQNWEITQQLGDHSDSILWELWTERPDLLRGEPHALRWWLEHHTQARRKQSPSPQWSDEALITYARNLSTLHSQVNLSRMWAQADIAATYEHPHLSPEQRAPLTRNWSFLLAHMASLDTSDDATRNSLGFLLILASRHLSPGSDAQKTIRELLVSIGSEPKALSTWLRKNLSDGIRKKHAADMLREIQKHRPNPGRWSYVQYVPHIHDEETEPTYRHQIGRGGHAEVHGREPGDSEDMTPYLMVGHPSELREQLSLLRDGEPQSLIWGHKTSHVQTWNGTDWLASVHTGEMEIRIYVFNDDSQIRPGADDMKLIREALQRGGNQRSIAAACLKRLSELLNIPEDDDLERWADTASKGNPLQRCSELIRSRASEDEDLPF